MLWTLLTEISDRSRSEFFICTVDDPRFRQRLQRVYNGMMRGFASGMTAVGSYSKHRHPGTRPELQQGGAAALINSSCSHSDRHRQVLVFFTRRGLESGSARIKEELEADQAETYEMLLQNFLPWAFLKLHILLPAGLGP